MFVFARDLNVCQNGKDDKNLKLERGAENNFLICQITSEEIISLPDNSTQSGSSVKQTNDVKNENCNKLLLCPIITRPTTLLDSYIWKIIQNISQNSSSNISQQIPISDLASPY